LVVGSRSVLDSVAHRHCLLCVRLVQYAKILTQVRVFSPLIHAGGRCVGLTALLEQHTPSVPFIFFFKLFSTKEKLICQGFSESFFFEKSSSVPLTSQSCCAIMGGVQGQKGETHEQR